MSQGILVHTRVASILMNTRRFSFKQSKTMGHLPTCLDSFTNKRACMPDTCQEIMVASPRRLMDVLEMRRVSLAQVKCIVIVEVDMILDMGFKQ